VESGVVLVAEIRVIPHVHSVDGAVDMAPASFLGGNPHVIFERVAVFKDKAHIFGDKEIIEGKVISGRFFYLHGKLQVSPRRLRFRSAFRRYRKCGSYRKNHGKRKNRANNSG
jgi:hypothetical protein